jgi:dTDP-glucose 4,6-dehydratase
MRLLVTGGAGFIGSNFIRYYLRIHPDAELVNVDLLTYAGNPENLSDLEHTAGKRYRFEKGDIADAGFIDRIMADDITAVINFAAESHVDRSIVSAAPFIKTNVLGTQVLMDSARKHKVSRFLQVSTDEVYGQLGLNDSPFTEKTPLAPRSPYSASKAAADLLARAYHQTYDFPVVITRCSNNYGPFQFPEKLLPLIITNALEGKALPIYGDGLYVRDWIHVEDHCRALDLVLQRGTPGEVYNIGGGDERANIDLVKSTLLKLAEATQRPYSEYETLIEYVSDRPGHDRRYAIDATRAQNELDFIPGILLEDGLSRTVAWYLEHREWWQRIKSGVYRQYYEEMYERR